MTVESPIIERDCWCGASAARRIGEFPSSYGSRPSVFPLVQCESCGVLALFPQPADDELSAAYAGEYYGSSKRKFVGPISRVIGWFQGGRAREIAKWVPAGGRVIDIGCGNGGFLLQLQQRGFVVEGTERTSASASRVPDGIRVHVGDLLDIDLPAGAYDAVTIWHVFEHVRQPLETMRKMRSLLKLGGRLLIEVPNAASAQAERYGTHWLHHDPPRHLFGFGPRSLGDLLRATGFEIEKANTFSLEQNPFGEIQSRLNASGTPRDRLYNHLKGTSDDALATRIADLTRMAIWAIPAVLRSTFESANGSGASLRIVARARENDV
jgi:SAM-dependent methyltransferase